MDHKFFWVSSKVKSGVSSYSGNGLVAKEEILKDERILIIGGYIMTLDEEAQLPDKCSDNGVQVSEEFVICI